MKLAPRLSDHEKNESSPILFLNAPWRRRGVIIVVDGRESDNANKTLIVERRLSLPFLLRRSPQL